MIYDHSFLYIIQTDYLTIAQYILFIKVESFRLFHVSKNSQYKQFKY